MLLWGQIKVMADSENRVIYTLFLVCYDSSGKLRKFYICAKILTLLWGGKNLQRLSTSADFYYLFSDVYHGMFQWRLQGPSVVVQHTLVTIYFSKDFFKNPQLYKACFYSIFLYHLSSVNSQLFVTGVVKHCSDSCFRPPLYTVLPCWRWILNMLNSCGDRSSGSMSPTSLIVTKSNTLASH